MLRALAAQTFLHTRNFGCRSAAGKTAVRASRSEVDEGNSQVAGQSALSLRLRQWLLPTQGDDCQLRLNTPPDTSKWLRNWRELDGQPSGSVVFSWPFAWASTVKIGVLLWSNLVSLYTYVTALEIASL
ncbi:hypothetical protein GKC28_25900 [Leisingera sp. ANG59]|nr:hypothetical protein [Leisingera sp. ANG59]